MTDRVIADLARERDRALRSLQALAAEIRTHENTMRRTIASPRRPADERLYRRLRQVNDGRRNDTDVDVPSAPTTLEARRNG